MASASVLDHFFSALLLWGEGDGATVKTHLNRTATKLDLDGHAQAVAVARQDRPRRPGAPPA
ncbi:hypothetical protein NRF20_08810 [Streptomyces sp. R-74717]|uniref:hypothetical protein n=1 Tax=Streptomyces TaxID=1883 RepID=UPI0037BDD1ED